MPGESSLRLKDMRLAAHLRLVWRGRKRIVAYGFFMALAGVVVALILPTVYQSNAIIQPREGSQQGLLGLSGLGGQGNQLSKLEMALMSRDLALDVLKAHPEFLGWLFPDEWDFEKGTWQEDVVPPPVLGQAGALLRTLKVKTILKQEVITLKVEAQDPGAAQAILAAYLERLNNRIRMTEKLDADSNRAFMEREIMYAQDPNLRERMKILIANEFERSHLVYNRAFDVVEAPAFFPQKVGPNRRKLVMVFFALGLLLGAVSLYTGILVGEGKRLIHRLFAE